MRQLRKAVSRVFQTYDIRGRYPAELTPEIAFRVGRALAAYLEEAMRVKGGAVALGRDHRRGSTELAAAVAHGLRAGGVRPVDIGLVSTDMVYFAAGAYAAELSGGVMITASHNPPGDNGLKFVLADARSIDSNTGLNIIRDIVIARNDEAPGAIPPLEAEARDCAADYLARLFAIAPGPFAPCKVVVDAGNGVAARVFPLLAERLPCEVVPLNFALDPDFPARGPDPSKHGKLAGLQAAVEAHKAGLGIAFDGDADRVVMVDETAAPVESSILTALFAQVMLRRFPGQKVLFDLTSSQVVDDCVREAGGEPVVAPVGHSRIKERMRERGALFAGEVSGHYYFRDFYCCDSAMLASLLALEVLEQAGRPLSALVDPLRRRYHRPPSCNIECRSRREALEIVARADRLVPDDQALRVTRMGHDVRKDFGDWSYVARPSGTEPRVARLNVEARDPAVAERRMAELEACARRRSRPPRARRSP